MTTETILTDAEIITIGHQARGIEPGENGYILPVTFARAIEQAVLAKLAEQEPVSYAAFADNGDIRFWTVNKADVERISRVCEQELSPLYAHPCVSPTSDKPTCVSEKAESETQTPDGRNIEDLADALYTRGYMVGGVKDWDPRGCREWQDVVDAYDSKFPEGWQLVPIEPTEEMHHAAREWSIGKYGKAIGFEASHGCYKAMITAAPKYEVEE